MIQRLHDSKGDRVNVMSPSSSDAASSGSSGSVGDWLSRTFGSGSGTQKAGFGLISVILIIGAIIFFMSNKRGL